MQRKVLINFKDKSLFDYNVPDDIKTGAIVEVPFGRQVRQGIVTDYKIDKMLEKSKIKSIIGQISNFALPPVSYKFLKWFCDYNMAPMGQALKMFVPTGVVKKARSMDFYEPNFKPVTLSDIQDKAYNDLKLNDGFKVNVLNGVTGSGKTEVY